MLKISKLTDYGLLASVYLARYAGKTIAAREIAQFYHLPLPMVTKVLKTLHQGGVIGSHRGWAAAIRSTEMPRSSRWDISLRRWKGPGISWNAKRSVMMVMLSARSVERVHHDDSCSGSTAQSSMPSSRSHWPISRVA